MNMNNCKWQKLRENYANYVSVNCSIYDNLTLKERKERRRLFFEKQEKEKQEEIQRENEYIK